MRAGLTEKTGYSHWDKYYRKKIYPLFLLLVGEGKNRHENALKQP